MATETTKEREARIAVLYSKPARRYGPGRKFYCAPWCGFNCTWAAYKAAKKAGAALAKRLGKGWAVRIWENGNWHYSATSPCGRIKVHANIDRNRKRPKVMDYTAFLGEPESCGGRWAEHGKTPRAAVRNVVAVARADLARIEASISGLERWGS